MKEEWEERSKHFGNSIKGVMFKGLPYSVNQYFHNWQEKVVLKAIKDGSRILDVGCGYGRLSLPIIEKFPDVDIMGLDVSQNYVRLYEANTGHIAAIGEIEDLNGFGLFDYIVCVTVLMYSDKPEIAMINMVSHLNPSGKLILIEPHASAKWFQGYPLFIRSSKTGGRSFTVGEIESFVNDAGGRVVSKKFNLPPIYVAYTIERIEGWKYPQDY